MDRPWPGKSPQKQGQCTRHVASFMPDDVAANENGWRGRGLEENFTSQDPLSLVQARKPPPPLYPQHQPPVASHPPDEGMYRTSAFGGMVNSHDSRSEFRSNDHLDPSVNGSNDFHDQAYDDEDEEDDFIQQQFAILKQIEEIRQQRAKATQAELFSETRSNVDPDHVGRLVQHASSPPYPLFSTSSTNPSSLHRSQTTSTIPSLTPTDTSEALDRHDPKDDSFYCDVSAYMSDPDFIREQRRILEETQQQRQDPRPPQSSPVEGTSRGRRVKFDDEGAPMASLASSSLHERAEHLSSFVKETTQQMMLKRSTRLSDSSLENNPEEGLDRPSIDMQCNHGSNHQGSSSTSSHNSSSTQGTVQDEPHPSVDKKNPLTALDKVSKLPNGQTVRIKGTQHVYRSITQGTAILVTCSLCGTISQVDARSQALFCVFCEHISPIRGESSLSSSRVPQSTSNDESSRRLKDGCIAAVVQQQELDVALARKMAQQTSTMAPIVSIRHCKNPPR